MKITTIGILFGLLAALFIGNVRARDLDGRHAQSPLKPWFDQLIEVGVKRSRQIRNSGNETTPRRGNRIVLAFARSCHPQCSVTVARAAQHR